MALNYSVCMRQNPINRAALPKAYASAQMNGELSLKELSRRVSQQTTLSRADVVAALTSTVENLFDALREGKQVDFGDLGKFRLQVFSKGADSLDKFTADHILGVTIQYLPGEDLKTIFQGLEFVPVASRKAQAAALRAEKSGHNVVDILTPTGMKEPGKADTDPGKQGGDPGKQGGDPGKQGGDPGKQGGDPGKQGGDPGKQEGHQDLGPIDPGTGA